MKEQTRSAIRLLEALTERAKELTCLYAIEELLTDPELRGEARAFFDEKTQGRPYVSPLPPGQSPPVPDDIGGGQGGR